MKFNFYILVFIISGNSLTAYCQAPNLPFNPTPGNQAGSGSVNPSLCATVSDPNGGTLQVRYFGRAKPTNGSEKFTIVLLPDTQFYTEEPQGNHDGANAAMFNAQTTWIANNRLSENIVYVGQLGDCVQNGDDPPGSNNEVEWQRAQSAISVIESPAQTGLPQGIPFGICVGNHDQTPGGSATGTTTYYNQYFGSNHFTSRNYYGGHYGSNNDNHYQLFSASGIDFLVISLEYDQSAGFSAAGGALDWAENLVQNNPGRKVIVMTHWAINENGSFGAQGQAIYNRLRNYSNFSFLMGGHVSSTSGGEALRTDIYNGNRVHSILTDYQSRPAGGNGLLRIYEFDPGLNRVSAKTYSPYTNTYETDANSQFELSFNMLPLLGQINNVSSGTNPCYNWTNLSFDTNYEWDMELYDGQNLTLGPIWQFTTPSGSSLPVSLIDFTVGIDHKKTKLSWHTSSEFNNDHFEIERSKDGLHFSKIGQVPGKGNSSSPESYIFFDEHPLNGKNFYRLNQVDVNNQSKYSKTVSIIFDGRSAFIALPNPVAASGVIRIQLKNEIKGTLKVKVNDMEGREVFAEEKNNAQDSFMIKPDLPTGTYFITLVSSDKLYSQKITVVNK